jgi:8-oxo-dGTP pyrophosphatase MutT (NUDIX family)
MKIVSAGVIVTDGSHILLGHVTGNRHWDIPKGKVDPGESRLEAAVRELQEETGMVVDTGDLIDLGILAYKRNKDLHLWLHKVENMPDPRTLECVSTFTTSNGLPKPEMDAFAIVSWKKAKDMVVPDMWTVLRNVYRNHVKPWYIGKSDHDK